MKRAGAEVDPAQVSFSVPLPKHQETAERPQASIDRWESMSAQKAFYLKTTFSLISIRGQKQVQSRWEHGLLVQPATYSAT